MSRTYKKDYDKGKSHFRNLKTNKTFSKTKVLKELDNDFEEGLNLLYQTN